MPVPSFVQSLGAANAVNVPCTPGAELWVTPGAYYSLTFWLAAGFCPESGLATVGPLVTPAGNTVQGALSVSLFGTPGWAGATLFQDTRSLTSDAGGGGGSVSGELTLQPFEYTAEQQGEIYSALALVFGAFLAALALAWGFKSVARLFAWHGHQGD